MNINPCTQTADVKNRLPAACPPPAHRLPTACPPPPSPDHRLTKTLSIDEARKLVLLSQWLPSVKPTGGALEATLAAVRHLGYIQIDTISVVERAHHHTIWNRTRRYRQKHLDESLRQKKIFEYWSHAAAYLPIEDYRFSLPRMRAFADGQRHWFAPDHKMMKKVLERIAIEGPLRARDFTAGFTANGVPERRGKADMWDWKPAKQALEQLFMEGKLMTARRQGFDKVYDLAEHVLPGAINTAMPTETEYGRFLITRFLHANGLGRAGEIAYQRPGLKPVVERCLAQMAQHGEVVPLAVKDRLYHALPASLELLNRPLSRKRLKILSPFDNLLIQRERMRHLFDFDYQIECYTPAHKRKHGYFSLPLLWGGKLVARMDCKADRPKHTLIIRNFVSEPSLTQKERLVDALADELTYFAAFNRCRQVEVGKLRDTAIRHLLNRALAGRCVV